MSEEVLESPDQKVSFDQLITELRKVSFDASAAASALRKEGLYREAKGIQVQLNVHQKALLDQFVAGNIKSEQLSKEIGEHGLDLMDQRHFQALGSVALLTTSNPREWERMYRTLGEVFGHTKGNDDSNFLDDEKMAIVVARLSRPKAMRGKVIDAEVESCGDVDSRDSSISDGGPEPQGLPAL